MRDKQSSQQVYAVIIGSPTDEFIRHACKLFCDFEVDYTLCENIYSAAAQLAKNGLRSVLVIGRFESLNKEEGWIFRKAGKGDFFCCCLVDSGSAWNVWRIAFKGTGIFIIDRMEEIDAVVMKVLRDGLAFLPKIEKVGLPVFSKVDFAATKAEMDALFGT